MLALLILAGIAAAIVRRRRRVREEEWVYDEPMAEERHEPMAEHLESRAEERQEPLHRPTVDEELSPIVAPAASAFSFGAREPATEKEPMVEPERLAGESWIERAYRGPSPSNPSVSLKARLRRGAFFDKRERDAAAGRAEPVDTTAGLPDRMVEEQERENA